MGTAKVVNKVFVEADSDVIVIPKDNIIKESIKNEASLKEEIDRQNMKNINCRIKILEKENFQISGGDGQNVDREVFIRLLVKEVIYC